MLPAGRQASVRTVIEAIEGPICLNLCLVSEASCSRKSTCPAHPVWARAQEAMLGILNMATIADLAMEAAASRVHVIAGSTEPA
jgi:DNA-binding IscR family transcriptional regulator